MDIEATKTLQILSPLYVLLVCLSGLLVGLLIFCVAVPAVCICWTWMGLRAIARETRSSWTTFNSGGLSSLPIPSRHSEPWE